MTESFFLNGEGYEEWFEGELFSSLCHIPNLLNCFVIFYISILSDRQRIRLKVERFVQTDSLEKYRVTAKNKSFVLQSNKPLLRGKGLKHKPVDWKVTEGGFDNSHFLQKIIKEIESKTS